MFDEESIEKSNLFFIESGISGSSIIPSKSYKNELKVNVTTVSDDKEFGGTNMKVLNEDYSLRLANFMKNSNKLLESSSRFKNEKSQANNLSESPLNTLIKLEEELLQLDGTNKVNQKYDFEMNEKQNLDDKPVFSDCDRMGSTHDEIQKRNLNTKYNFQDALKIDDLENQIHNFQKQLNDKNVIIKDLQLKLQYFQNFKVVKNIIHHHKSTEFGDELMKVDIKIKDQNINCSLNYEQFCNQFNLNEVKYNKCDVLKYSSIEDYDPNNPAVLKNKIKDLESQIEDLQEANEVASMIFSSGEKVRIENSSNKSNEEFSELIDKNKTLQNEVKKLKENSCLINENLLTKHMQEELENVKQELSFLKQHNKKMFDENRKLKSIIEKTDWFLNVDNIDKNYKMRKQTNTNKLNEFIKHSLTDLEQNVERNINLLSYDKILCNRENVELSNDSTDSILSDVNKEIDSIKIKQVEINKIVNDEINPMNDDGYEYLISANKELLKRNPKTLFGDNESNQFNTFSTLGRTAFAPRSGADININDVVKFIRQGGRISKGIVHFIGRLPKRNDIYLGMELEIEEGKHDGIYEGIRYFHCREKKGVFVAFNKVIMVYSMNMDR